MTWKRFLSPPFFLLALLCFLLPFFAVTCAGGGFSGVPGLGGAGDPADVTGLQLVTGEAEDEVGQELSEFAQEAGGSLGGEDLPIPGPTPSIPDISQIPGSSDRPDLGMTQIWAIASAAVALFGIFLALIAGRLGAVFALVLGVAGAGLLFLLSSQFSSAIQRFGENVLTGEPRLGFWLAVGGFVIAAITGLLRLLLPDRPAGAAPATTTSGFGQPPGAPPPAAPPPPESPPQ